MHHDCRRYAQLAQEAAGDTSTKMKRLSKEIRDLQRGKNELPLQPAASIFLRHDADRMDMLRACITGIASVHANLLAHPWQRNNGCMPRQM